MLNLLKKIKFNPLILFLVFGLLSITSCKDDDEVVQDNSALFSEMQEALGGENNIANAATVKYESTGVAFEFQEDPEPVNGKVADYTYSLLYNLDGTQSKQDWDVNAEYAYATEFAFLETIDNTNGKSEGITGTFKSLTLQY